MAANVNYVRITKEDFMKTLLSCYPAGRRAIPDWTLDCRPPHGDSDYEWQIIGIQLVGTSETGIPFAESVNYVGSGLDELLSALESKLGIGAALAGDGRSRRLSDVWSGQPEQDGISEVAAVSDGTGLPPWRDVLLEYTVADRPAKLGAEPEDGEGRS